MKSKFFDKGELKDKKIVKALKQAAVDYEDGAIAEVKDLLTDIVMAIEAWEEEYDGK